MWSMPLGNWRRLVCRKTKSLCCFPDRRTSSHKPFQSVRRNSPAWVRRWAESWVPRWGWQAGLNLAQSQAPLFPVWDSVLAIGLAGAALLGLAGATVGAVGGDAL